LQGVVRLALESPALLRAHRPGERIDDDVDVRRHVQPEELLVVADVRDDGHVFLRHHLYDALEKARRPNPAGEHRELHTARRPPMNAPEVTAGTRRTRRARAPRSV